MDRPPIARKLKKPNASWIRPLEEGAGARYQQIARQIVQAVEDGVLRPGDRLPPQRELAQAMGVDLTTVTRAYAEVRLAGLLDAQGAGGSYIATSVAQRGTTVDLSMNIPPLLGSPAFARLMQAGMERVRDHIGYGELMSYHVGAGARTDREAAAIWLEPMLGPIDINRVVVCPGAQSALAALMLTLSQPGDAIAADGLNYPGFLAAARVLQRTVAIVASDQEGLLPADLDRVCRDRRPAMIYLVPTIQNPTTSTMSAQRRKDIHAVASRYSVPIVEDDPYWLLAGDAAPPVATLAEGAREAPVFYLSTLSKCLAPGLRTAYLVVPPMQPLEPLLDALRSISLMATQSMVAVTSHCIRTGLAMEMMQKIRQELGQRQKLAARILPGSPQAHPYGPHLWLPLPARLDQYRLIRTALEQGLGVTGSEVFSADESAPDAIRISLGGASDQASLKSALEKLAEILSAERQHRMAAIV